MGTTSSTWLPHPAGLGSVASTGILGRLCRNPDTSQSGSSETFRRSGTSDLTFLVASSPQTGGALAPRYRPPATWRSADLFVNRWPTCIRTPTSGFGHSHPEILGEGEKRGAHNPPQGTPSVTARLVAGHKGPLDTRSTTPCTSSSRLALSFRLGVITQKAWGSATCMPLPFLCGSSARELTQTQAQRCLPHPPSH